MVESVVAVVVFVVEDVPSDSPSLEPAGASVHPPNSSAAANIAAVITQCRQQHERHDDMMLRSVHMYRGEIHDAVQNQQRIFLPAFI